MWGQLRCGAYPGEKCGNPMKVDAADSTPRGHLCSPEVHLRTPTDVSVGRTALLSAGDEGCEAVEGGRGGHPMMTVHTPFVSSQ